MPIVLAMKSRVELPSNTQGRSATLKTDMSVLDSLQRIVRTKICGNGEVFVGSSYSVGNKMSRHGGSSYLVRNKMIRQGGLLLC